MFPVFSETWPLKNMYHFHRSAVHTVWFHCWWLMKLYLWPLYVLGGDMWPWAWRMRPSSLADPSGTLTFNVAHRFLVRWMEYKQAKENVIATAKPSIYCSCNVIMSNVYLKYVLQYCIWKILYFSVLLRIWHLLATLHFHNIMEYIFIDDNLLIYSLSAFYSCCCECEQIPHFYLPKWGHKSI